jgi:hypothetical protein
VASRASGRRHRPLRAPSHRPDPGRGATCCARVRVRTHICAPFPFSPALLKRATRSVLPKRTRSFDALKDDKPLRPSLCVLCGFAVNSAYGACHRSAGVAR